MKNSNRAGSPSRSMTPWVFGTTLDERGQAHLRERQGGLPQGVAAVELHLPLDLGVDFVAIPVVVGQSQVDVGEARPRAGRDEPGLHAAIDVEIGDILDREFPILRERQGREIASSLDGRGLSPPIPPLPNPLLLLHAEDNASSLRHSAIGVSSAGRMGSLLAEGGAGYSMQAS